MKFMLNGALTLGTMDGANVEIVEEVGEENAFIFGLSADEVLEYERNGGYDPMQYFNRDADIRNVLMQLINGRYSGGDMEMFRDLYNSLLYPQGGSRADVFFILADFKSYVVAQERVSARYTHEEEWAKSAILNIAHAGKFSSDRTIEEYAKEIWKMDPITVRDENV
jgi:starch phosphorylase